MFEKNQQEIFLGTAAPRAGERVGNTRFTKVELEGRTYIKKQYVDFGVDRLGWRQTIEREKENYHHLESLGIEVPDRIDLGDDSVTTEVCGIGLAALLRGLFQPRGKVLHLNERDVAAMLIARLNAERDLARKGIVDFDTSHRNRTIRLTGGLKGGNLRYDKAVIIDPAELVTGSGAMRRPTLLDVNTPTFPPEARVYVVNGQERLRERMNSAGLKGATLRGVVQSIRNASSDGAVRTYRNMFEEIYANYAAPQEIQAAMASGNVSADKMAQYSFGKECLDMIREQELPLSTRAALNRCGEVLKRMAAPEPNHRFQDLDAAIKAIRDCWTGVLPTQSEFVVTAHNVENLIPGLRSRIGDGSDFLGDGTTTFSIEDEPAAQERQYSLSGRPPTKARFIAAGLVRVVLGVGLVLLLAGYQSLRVPESPEKALHRAQVTKINKLMAAAGDMKSPSRQTALGELRKLAPAQAEQVKVVAETHYREIQRKYFLKSLAGKGVDMMAIPADVQRQLIVKLDVLGQFGSAEAKSWLVALQKLQGVPNG